MLRQLVRALPLLVVFASIPAGATVLVPADFRELAREATVIVHARVVSVESVWTDGRRTVETIVTLEVSEALKGRPGTEVSVRVPGGRMGRYRSVVVGAPTFREGQEVVLFLGGRAPALSHLLGFSQGVYRVHRDRSGRALVTPPIANTAGVRAPVKIQRGDPARGPVALADFTRQVREAVETPDERERARRRPAGGKEIR
ncbi:MAG TPA: hypothetical protein VK911_11690 [Vicinamibacterales bacterium]|nr:hypothetical protein [Vicinamibacterales bacterium]